MEQQEVPACWVLQEHQVQPQLRDPFQDYHLTLDSTPCIHPFHNLSAPWPTLIGECFSHFNRLILILYLPRSHYSSMSNLSSMSTSCLQNRDASSYYSMFHHDPLSSLSSYGRSCGVASQSSAINSHMGSYGSALSSPSAGTGTAASGKFIIHIQLQI